MNIICFLCMKSDNFLYKFNYNSIVLSEKCKFKWMIFNNSNDTNQSQMNHNYATNRSNTIDTRIDG